MKVLHVLAPAMVGGLESVVCTLIPAQREAGIDARAVAVLVPGESENHPVVEKLRGWDVPIDIVSVSARAYSRERRHIAALCKALRPDVVHTHGYRTDLVDSAVANRLSIPRMTTLHGFTGGPFRNRLYELLQERAARRMDAVIAVSRPLADRLLAGGVSADRLHVVPNAHRLRADFLDRAAARQALGLPPNGFVIGWVGRLTSEKGADVFIDAVARLAETNLVACMLGDGAQRQSLVARAESTAPGRVHWRGIVPDSARFLKAFDVFVLSSRTEGTPMVIFEAMDAGVPIVATRVGGVPDVLREHDAQLVAPEDPVAIAAAIRHRFANPAEALTRVEWARTRLASDYGVAAWVEQYATIYRRIARRTGDR